MKMNVLLATTYFFLSNFISAFPSLYNHVKQPATISAITQESFSFHIFASSGDGDDDGWDDSNDPLSTSISDEMTTSREKELASLRSQMAIKKEESNSSSRNDRSSVSVQEERDLFIPIFALVSLGGLFGAYGYEMLRLYSRGELYLPGQ